MSTSKYFNTTLPSTRNKDGKLLPIEIQFDSTGGEITMEAITTGPDEYRLDTLFEQLGVLGDVEKILKGEILASLHE